MLTGAELAMIVGIASSFVTCTQYTSTVYEKVKKKREHARVVRLAKQLELTLQGGHTAIEAGLGRLSGLGHVFGRGPGRSARTLTEANALIENLRDQLRALVSQNNLFIAPELARHNATAERTRSLTLASLQQHANPLIAASASMLSLPLPNTPPNDVMPAPSILTIPSVISQPLILGRTLFNVNNLCLNAIRYRDNTHSFHELTRPANHRPYSTWACTHCGAELTRVILRLLPPPSPPADNIWIDAAGMLQAHCHAGGAWSCIWPVRDADACGSPFAGERALLEHMRRWHVELRGEGAARAAAVDWPADVTQPSAAECGFGVCVGGRAMREGSGNFVVPPAARRL